MAITIDKRIRALATDDWGDWLTSTDAPPYTNTDLIEYRVNDNSTFIEITDITNTVTTDGDNIVSGQGYFDDLMETATKHLEAQASKSYIEGDNYARVYAGVMNNLFNQSIQFALAKRNAELRADTANIEVDKKKEELDLMYDTHQFKVESAENQADKILADKLNVEEQTIQLPRSVRYNNRIKGLDSLMDMMGTFGAGGLTFDDSQWTFMYDQLASLITDLNDYKGEWNASINTPDISAVTDMEEGDFYRVSTAGGTNLDGTDTWAINDVAVYIGERWIKSDVIIPSSFNVEVVS